MSSLDKSAIRSAVKASKMLKAAVGFRSLSATKENRKHMRWCALRWRDHAGISAPIEAWKSAKCA